MCIKRAIHSMTIVLGGHTTESLTLLGSLDFSRYTPRTYIVSQGDLLSVQKAIALEASKMEELVSQPVSFSQLALILRPRIHLCFSGETHLHNRHYSAGSPCAPAAHSYTPDNIVFSSHGYLAPYIFTTATEYGLPRSSHSQWTGNMFLTLYRCLSQPSTFLAVQISFPSDASLWAQFLGIASPRLIYIESFARVKTLSLSGKLLQYIVDRYVHSASHRHDNRVHMTI